MRAYLLGLLMVASGLEAADRPDEPLPSSKLQPLAKPGMVESLRPLYSLTVDEPPKGGKEMKLTIQETQRNQRTSLITYTYVSGPGVGTSMTVVFALYRIALDRGAKFFIVLQTNETRKPTEYLVGFAANKVENPSEHFEVNGKLDDKLHWWSVAELAGMFGQMK